MGCIGLKQSHGCISILAHSGVLVHPRSSNITLGQNASFYCKASGKTARWYVNGAPITTALADKGFEFQEAIEGSVHNLNATVLGTIANNGTVLWCTVKTYGSHIEESSRATLIVIGEYTILMSNGR